MTLFYTADRARACRQRARASRAAAALAVGGCFLICAVLCTRVQTGNAANMFRWVLILSVLSGWAAIALMHLVSRPAMATWRHMESLLRETPETHAGTLTVLPEAFQIPRGIRVKKAVLHTREGPLSLRLDAALEKRLPVSVPVRVQVARQYITAIEVQHEND